MKIYANLTKCKSFVLNASNGKRHAYVWCPCSQSSSTRRIVLKATRQKGARGQHLRCDLGYDTDKTNSIGLLA